MANLVGKTAVVTGASRGVGRGIALGLGEAGATVYVTGRSVEEGQEREGLRGTIVQTANEVTAKEAKVSPFSVTITMIMRSNYFSNRYWRSRGD